MSRHDRCPACVSCVRWRTSRTAWRTHLGFREPDYTPEVVEDGYPGGSARVEACETFAVRKAVIGNASLRLPAGHDARGEWYLVVMSHQTLHHIGWQSTSSMLMHRGGQSISYRRTYELDEDIYIDILEGSRQFDPPWRFHAPIAAVESANLPDLCSLFPAMEGDECGETKIQGRDWRCGQIQPMLRLDLA